MPTQTSGKVLMHKQGGQVTNPRVIRSLVEDLEDGGYLVSFQSTKKRSLSQNAYYWAVVVPMMFDAFQHRGYGAEIHNHLRMHAVLKEKFLKVPILNQEVDEDTGEVEELFEPLTYTRDSSELSPKEFNQYLEDIWGWAKEKLDLDIPPPGSAPELPF